MACVNKSLAYDSKLQAKSRLCVKRITGALIGEPGGRGRQELTLQSTGTTLHKSKKNRPLMSCLHQAYVGLMLAPESEDGSRIVSLARYGAFEVRLVEFHHCTSEVRPFWVELYCQDTQASLDSYLCDDLESAEVATEQFTSHARGLELN